MATLSLIDPQTQLESSCKAVTPRLEASRFEARLVERVQAGDGEACEALVRQYGPRMLSVARRIVSQEEDAQDALQDAFVQAFRAMERFRGDAKLSTWLHRIVVNAALLKLRAQKRRHEVEIEGLLPRFDEEGHRIEIEDCRATSASEELERAEVQAMVRERISQLPQAYREVILLRDIEGLDTAETARALGVSENAAKIRLHRARQALMALLESSYNASSLHNVAPSE